MSAPSTMTPQLNPNCPIMIRYKRRRSPIPQFTCLSEKIFVSSRAKINQPSLELKRTLLDETKGGGALMRSIGIIPRLMCYSIVSPKIFALGCHDCDRFAQDRHHHHQPACGNWLIKTVSNRVICLVNSFFFFFLIPRLRDVSKSRQEAMDV